MVRRIRSLRGPGTALLVLVALSLPGPAEGGQDGKICGDDKNKPHIAVQLVRLTGGGTAIGTGRVTDMAFLPMAGPQVLVTADHKAAKLIAWDLGTGRRADLLTVTDPATGGMEQGIVSFTFHPNFPEDRRLYTMHDGKGEPAGQSVLTEWTVQGEAFPDFTTTSPRVLLTVPQPEGGHNAGQVRFGPDGLLYQSFGDGGFQRDPDRRGQSRSELYSSIIRIDVDGRTEGLEYSIPPDNPFVGDKDVRAEIWAYGFRNPWRFGWAPDGRMIEADVGQERYEELNIVEPGRNYGWSLREGPGCLTVTSKRVKECEEACASGALTLTDPIHHYGRSEGGSIIGGVFASGAAAPKLQGRYIFGDYASGKLWALDLPDPSAPLPLGCAEEAPAAASVHALGRFSVQVISFAETPEGDVLVGGGYGAIWKIVALSP